MSNKTLLIVLLCFLTIIAVAVCIALLLHNKSLQKTAFTTGKIEIPIGYDHTYEESESAWKRQQQLDEEGWSAMGMQEDFLTVTLNTTSVDSSFSGTPSLPASGLTASDETIIMLPENDAWSYISNGLFKGYPSGSFNDNKAALVDIQQHNTQTITVKCWYWADPSDNTNFEKVTKEKVFAVNSAIAPLFIHAFEDIYNHPDKPIINLGDGGMGTWVLRGKNHNDNARLSTHSLGCCIDINPSTGSFNINGSWYGNGYGHKTMTSDIWEQLPECHNKYHVLYDGSPIVETFKSYGFVWGGDWLGTKDCMHLSFIGEGSNCRAKGQKNYLERK